MSLVRPAPRADLSGRSVLSLRHHSSESIAAILELAADLKTAARPWPNWLAGRVVALIFEKPSTRTRVSFETAIARLGGTAVTMNAGDLQLGRGETVEDTAIVLSRFVDAIVIRAASHERVEELARCASVPVVNALTPAHHPCQGLADAQTLIQRFGDVAGLPIAYLGDGNNCFNSLAVMAAHLGLNLTCGSPAGYLPSDELVSWANTEATARGGSVRVTSDPRDAVANVRAIYTDVWVSMGDEAQETERLRAFAGFEVNQSMMDLAGPGAIALHPLPAHYGLEIAQSVAHGPQSALWDEAENRLHAQAALLTYLLPELEQ